jgi:transposase
VNADSVKNLWEQIELKHPKESKVHICDNARYYHSKILKDWLSAHPHVKVLFLPTYAPNLNLIEHLWKLLRKEKINSFVYKNFEEFREGVMDFFENSHRWETALYALLTLKFRVMGY